jgi:hypothetical protein
MTKKKARKDPAKKISADECIIPPAFPKEELHKLLFRQSEYEAQRIREYVEWQSHGDEAVLHVEKVASERVFGATMMFGMCIRTKNAGG